MSRHGVFAKLYPTFETVALHLLAPIEKMGEENEQMYFYYTFYTVCTHGLTFCYITLKYSCTSLTSCMVTGDGIFQKTWPVKQGRVWCFLGNAHGCRKDRSHWTGHLCFTCHPHGKRQINLYRPDHLQQTSICTVCQKMTLMLHTITSTHINRLLVVLAQTLLRVYAKNCDLLSKLS